MKLSFGERIALTYLFMTIGTLIGYVVSYLLFDKTIKDILGVAFLYFMYTTAFAVALYYSPSGE